MDLWILEPVRKQALVGFTLVNFSLDSMVLTLDFKQGFLDLGYPRYTEGTLVEEP